MASQLVDFLKSKEGEVKRGNSHVPYRDDAGVWTIGYGHTGNVTPEMRLSDEEAENLLKTDIQGFEDAYDKLVTVDLPQNQKDAVVSLMFNVGKKAFEESKALSHLNAARFDDFKREAFDPEVGFTKVTNPATGEKSVNDGLVNRRAAEQDLFGQGLANVNISPPQPRRPDQPHEPEVLAAISDSLLERPHPVTGHQVSLNPVTRLPESPKAQVSGVDAFVAGWILNNPISGSISKGEIPFVPETFKSDPNYDIMTDPQLEGEELMNFVDSRSAQQSRYMKQNVDRNMANQLMANNPGGGWGAFLGTVADPLVMGTAIATSGSSMAVAAAADVSAEILRETILHSQQPLRTKMETAFNVATVGIIDASLWRLGRTVEKRALLQQIRETSLAYLKDPKPQFTYVGVTDTGKIRVKPKLADDTLPLTVAAEGEGTVDGFIPGMSLSPAGSVISGSFSETAKLAVQQLVDVPYRFVKSVMGGKAVPVSAESRIKKAHGDFAAMTEIFAEQFKAYKKAGGEMSDADFLLEVHRGMETGTVHADPNIARVTKYYKKMDDQYFDAEGAMGLTGLGRRKGGHIQRIYSQAKISGNRSGLKQVISKYIKRLGDTGAGQRLVRYGDGEYDVLSEEALSLARVDDPNIKIYDNDNLRTGSEIDEITNDIVAKIVGVRTDDLDMDMIVFAPGSSKSRTLDFIPTRELEPWLETSALAVMGVRARQHYRATAMQKAFPDDPTMAKTLEKVSDEYVKLMDEPGANVPVLKKQLIHDLEKLRNLRDGVLGVYGIPDNPTSAIVKGARAFRILTLMGYGANISSTSLTDMITPAIRNALAPFQQGMRVMFKKALKKEFLQQIRQMGIAVEKVTSNKAAMLINMAEISKTEQQALKWYGKFSGLDWVTDTSQAYNAMGHSLMWKKWFDNWENLGSAKKLRLLDVGIDDKMAARIKKQWDLHGETIDGVRTPSASLWTDDAAAELFENALRKEVYMTTLVPGKGDIPHWMQTEPGKFFGMFQSFVAGAHQRLLIAGFQRGDAAFYTGIIVSALAGGLVQAGKDLARGKNPLDKNPIEYAVDSLDKTGLLGWFSIPIQTMSMVAAGQPAEFAWRNMSDTVFSAPPLEWATVFGIPALGGLQGDMPTQDQAMRMLKAAPFANTLHAVDLAENYLLEEE